MTDQSPAGEKLQKVLARSGVGSRREMERAITEGRVRVDGKIAKLGDRVDPAQKLELDGRPVRTDALEKGARVLAYHKPEGEITTRNDPQGRPTVFDNLPRLRGQRWIAIGRLDLNTSGLMLFTTDGELANRLMHPSAGVDREYRCRVFGSVTPDVLQRLRTGVELDDGPARFSDITPDREGDGINHWYTVCLLEGRNREVRRLWESQQLQVNRLKRVRYGPVFLPSWLRQGQCAQLEEADVRALYEGCGLPVPLIYQPPQREQEDAARRETRQRAKGSKKPASPALKVKSKGRQPQGRTPKARK